MTEEQALAMIRTGARLIRAAHEYAGPTLESLRHNSMPEDAALAIDNWELSLRELEWGDFNEERMRVRGLVMRLDPVPRKMFNRIDDAFKKERERRNV